MWKSSKLWVLVFVVAGCRVSCHASDATVNSEELEKMLETKLAVGGTQGHASCPQGLEPKVGATFQCQLELEKTKYDIDVTITSINPKNLSKPLDVYAKFTRGHALWRSVVERGLQEQLRDELGVSFEVVCGAEPLLFLQNNRVACQVRSGNVRTSMTLTMDDKLALKTTPLDPPLLSRKKLEALLREGTKAEFGPDMVIDCGSEDIIARPADGAVRCQASKGAEKAPLDVVVTHDTEHTSWKLLAPKSWKLAAAP